MDRSIGLFDPEEPRVWRPGRAGSITSISGVFALNS